MRMVYCTMCAIYCQWVGGKMMDVNSLIANNLRTIHEEKKLSLDSLAKITGVSKSMLGQIERDEVNPTISVLWKIANGLKISFTSLMEVSIENAEIIKYNNITPLIEDDGKFVNHPIFLFDENKRFETYRIEIKPKGSLDAEAHLSGTEEFITVFRGELIITVNRQEYKLDTGDSIHFRADVAHSYRNDGNDYTDLSMVIYYV